MRSNFSTATFGFTVLTFLMVGILIIYGPFHWWGKNIPQKPPKILPCSPVFFEIIGGLTPIAPHNFYDSASIPHDISANGIRVVGESRADEAYEPYDGMSPSYVHCAEAFGWTRPCSKTPFYLTPASFFPPKSPKTGIIPFGYSINSNSSHTESYAFGISPDGKVSVGYNTYGFPDPSTAKYKGKPVVFLPDGIYPITLIDTTTVAIDLSNPTSVPVSSPKSFVPGKKHFLDGRIIVGWTSNYDKEPSILPGRAIYWDAPDHPVELRRPDKIFANDSSVISSEATCISDDGSIIGGNLFYNFRYDNYHYASVPCVWKRKLSGSGFVYEITELSDLANGDLNARILHISGNGNCVVGYGNETSSNDSCSSGAYAYKACYWEFSGPAPAWSIARPLGNLSGTMASGANGVNFDGSVIVGSCLNITGPCDNLEFKNKASIWRKLPAGMTVEDLNTLLSSVVPVNWNLYYAVRVSANGKIITGYTYDFENDREIGWVVGIP